MATTNMTPFWQLPPLPRPPHDPTWWLLNGRVGWKAELLDGVRPTGQDGRLVLEIFPGTGRLLNEASGSFGGLTVPSNVAISPDGGAYLLDRTSGTLKRLDPCTCSFADVPCFGGIGAGPRQLRNPSGIAICNGNLFVCDTGNNRLLVLSLFGFVLRAIWSPPPAAGLTHPWQPTGVALDGRGRVFVSDPANGCIHRFRPRGQWDGCLPGFGGVSWIAVDCSDILYSVVTGQNDIRITDTNGNPKGTASRPDQLAESFPPLPFTVDAYGNLKLGPLCVPPTDAVFDARGAVLMPPLPKDPPTLFLKTGVYWSEPLDSKLYRCKWHRVVLRGQLPAGTAIRVSTYTTEAEESFDMVQALPIAAWKTNLVARAMVKDEWDGLIFSDGGRYLRLRLEFAGSGTATPVLESIRVEYPRISLRRYLPAAFGEDPNGANFTDRFLSNFDTTLRSVESQIDTEARLFDPASTPATPDPITGVDFLSWLASWIGVTLDRQWPEAKRRQILKHAARIFPIRGTRYGLWQQLLLFLGMQAEACCCPDDQPRKVCIAPPPNCSPKKKLPCAWQPPPLILEHYQLRRWLFLGAGRLGDQAVLWGKRIVDRSQLGENAQAGVTKLVTTPDPYHDPFLVYANRFSVFVPSACGASDTQKRALLNLLEAEKPAHTAAQLEYVEPRFRIGFQSMIGLDTVVGRYPAGVKLGETPLGSGSVVTEPPGRRSSPSFEIGRQSRIGSTTKLD